MQNLEKSSSIKMKTLISSLVLIKNHKELIKKNLWWLRKMLKHHLMEEI